MPSTLLKLDQKLDRIRSGDYTPQDFIIADAKDGDMGGGAGATGIDSQTGCARPAAFYRAAMKEMAASGMVDIMLMSLSSAEALATEDVCLSNNVTPAVRLNEGTDIWGFR